MTSRDFCYWLQGYFELSSAGGQTRPVSLAEVDLIKRHLAMVFLHDLDPKAGPPSVQQQLNQLHGGETTIMRC